VLGLPERLPRAGLLLGGLIVALLLAGPSAYALDTITTAYAGGDPKAGPASAQGPDGVGLGGPGGTGGSFRDGTLPATDPFDGTAVAPNGSIPADGRFAPGDGGADGARGPGSATSDPALVAFLVANQGDATWIVATTSAMSAGGLELASGQPVMAMGGFSGGDPAPTLDQLKAYVASKQLRYVLISGAGGFAGPGGGNSTTSEIDAWVRSVGATVDYGGNGGTLYDLSGVSS
jgi:hypothetical protein